MRIALALAVILAVWAQAKAEDVGRMCAAQADAKALHGQERIRFEAKCKARQTNATIVNGNGSPVGEQRYGLCAGNIADVFIGSCPLCVLLFALGDDSHCYVR
jgi:hypothetical protein